jgi:tetratricopeptide (TPR) repeat protein
MIDLFESIIKTHTAVIISEYVRHNNLSEAAKGMLSQGLRTPSLGTWQLFSRVLFEELEKDQFQWSISHFPKEFADLDRALNNEKTNVIAFRNGYAHGATPSDEACVADIAKFESFLLKLLQSQWLQESSLDVREGKVCLCTSSTELSLHPILIFRDEKTEASFAFFNDIKNDKIGLLNYPLGKHYREKDFYQEFLSHLPLNEWKKSGNNEFYQRIEELTESFKGRTIERKRLLDFVVEKNKGYFSIQGNPGIGKSALIAQFFKDLKGFKEAQNFSIVEYFIRRGTQQAQAEYLFQYLIKRTDELFPQGREIRAEGKLIFDLQNQLFSKWRQWNEHSQGKKLIFLIDGLDEGTEANVPVYLPRENFENVLIIYGSRPGGHKSIDDLWGTLPPEHHEKLELTGLGKEDIRALIYEVANKYEVERESFWIDAVQQRSQGNPLYLKLLCDAIENNGIALNDVQALPTKIDEYYKAILLRYANDVDGEALLSGLFTFAAAKDYLTMSHLGLINGIGSATLMRIGSTLKEVLYENPLTEEVLDYQLFHESFREYLVKEQAKEVSAAQQRIIAFCAVWKELKGDWEQRYALEHYAAHLHESAKEQHGETLLKLMYDTEYQATQKKVLRGFEATNALFRLSLLKASDVKRYEDQLEAALCLVDLKYEEANDAPQIMAMVAAGEIDLALKRIESFGGSDQEGMQRKFTLYMLCLMELTLLDSKDKPFRKEGIEKMLNHLDEHIPTDTSLINWNDFFPSYLMFQMACEWAELSLDYTVVYKRTDDCEKDWISEKGPYSSLQFQVLKEIASGDDGALLFIAEELKKQDEVVESTWVIQESLDIARGKSDEFFKCDALNAIARELNKQGQLVESASVIQESLSITRSISSDLARSRALNYIAEELIKLGQVEESASVIQESLAIARSIRDEGKKSRALLSIVEVYSQHGKIEESLSIAHGISDESDKSSALNAIACELCKQGQLGESASMMQESLAIALVISDESDKSSALKDIAVELSKQGQVEESLSIAHGISDEWYYSSALEDIALELSKHGQLQKSLAIARGISDDLQKSGALKDIAIELSKQGQVEESVSVMQESLAIVRAISDDRQNDREKIGLLNVIARELNKQGQLKEATSVWQESLSISRGITDESDKSKGLKEIAESLSKQGQMKESAAVMQESLISAPGIIDESKKVNALLSIAEELSKQGQVEKSLSITRSISSDLEKSHALLSIALELSKQGRVEESLAIVEEISYYNFESSALLSITAELSKQGQVEESLAIARGISDEFWQSRALNAIAIEMNKKGQLLESASVIQESLSIARSIRSISDLNAIAVELNKQGQLEESISVLKESLSIAHCKSDEYQKSRALLSIAAELSKLGKVRESTSVLQESLAIVRSFNDDRQKDRKKIHHLNAIARELNIQGQSEEATSVWQESLCIARSMSNEYEKNRAFHLLVVEGIKLGQAEELLAIFRGINMEKLKSDSMHAIAVELSKQGDFAMAEEVGLEIAQIAQRQDTWKEMAKSKVETEGWQNALKQVAIFTTEEAKSFYLKGWTENAKATDVNHICIQQALPMMVNDNSSIENLLKNYAVKLVIMGNPSRELTDRLNRTLNIQWALDIAVQFPKPEATTRLSTNLDTWLHEIADEDDREQIELWAKQVAKGKITEEEFGERVRGLM